MVLLQPPSTPPTQRSFTRESDPKRVPHNVDTKVESDVQLFLNPGSIPVYVCVRTPKSTGRPRSKLQQHLQQASKLSQQQQQDSSLVSTVGATVNNHSSGTKPSSSPYSDMKPKTRLLRLKNHRRERATHHADTHSPQPQHRSYSASRHQHQNAGDSSGGDRWAVPATSPSPHTHADPPTTSHQRKRRLRTGIAPKDNTMHQVTAVKGAPPDVRRTPPEEPAATVDGPTRITPLVMTTMTECDMVPAELKGVSASDRKFNAKWRKLIMRPARMVPNSSKWSEFDDLEALEATRFKTGYSRNFNGENIERKAIPEGGRQGTVWGGKAKFTNVAFQFYNSYR
eukprot:TRINITY_DN69575_c0_g1_i1.p1 TRINITY_DN69575_c0_g1~~TRINITY_DN69575_c0_g1_i1.p1  ORF type:complete len:340 (-),score=22.01 TRINITY_DN69575_c0_g1_i1:96-1115(-)